MGVEHNLSVEEMKKIAHQIIEEEARQSNTKINIIFPLTIIEYYNEYVFKQKCKLTSIPSLLARPIIAGGFNDNLTGNIIIFLDRSNRVEKTEQRIFKLALICYHEARHSMQHNFDKYSYDGFLRDLDSYIYSANSLDYRLAHDKYSFEIGANIYGITKAKEFLQKNYPDLYEKEREEIEQLEKKYYFDYMTYDVSDTIDRTIKTLKAKNKSSNEQKNDNIDQISPVLQMFLNEDTSFKRISEIMQNDKFKTIDKRIIYAFLTSRSFLESVNMEKLTDEELALLRESLQYTNTVYQNQQRTIEQFRKQGLITLKEYLTSQKSLLNKFSFTHRYLSSQIMNKFNNTFNFERNEILRQNHIDSIPDYLDEANQLERKRTSRGYMTINICYVVGMLISIVTMIYLLLKV